MSVCGSELRAYFTPNTKVNSPGPSSVPSFIKSFARFKSPVSKISNSGITPASRITFAITRTEAGVFTAISLTVFMVFKSKEQISGFKAVICSTLLRGWHKLVPGAKIFGSSVDGTKRAPTPVVKLITSSRLRALIKCSTSA